MKNLLKLEELLLALLAFYLFLPLGYAWWWFPILFFAPDLSMVGYALGPQVGATIYNLVHHKGVAVALFVLGGFWQVPGLQFAGTILLSHSSFDRVLGYGLKHLDAFHHTHLGHIGPAAADTHRG